MGNMAHFSSGGFAGNRDEGIVQARPLDAQRFDPGATVYERLEQRLGTSPGQLEPPFAANELGRSGQGGTPRAVFGARPEMDDGAKPSARLVDRSLECRPALGDD